MDDDLMKDDDLPMTDLEDDDEEEEAEEETEDE